MHTHELTLGLAFGLGALHALEPGHGKTAMLVYLAGERRNFFHPLVIGLSSALSHSLSLIGVAAVVHLTHHLITGDHHHHDQGVAGLLQWISAAIIIAIGLWMTWTAWRAKPNRCGCGQHAGHCDEAERPATSNKISYSMSAMLGVAFGLLPCPSAMAAFFTSMSTGTPVAAYAVIGLFAAGIASSITVAGILVQLFGERLMNRQSRLAKLPWAYIRAALILAVGLIYLGKAITK